MSLVRSFLAPAERLAAVLGHAVAHLIAVAEVVLRTCIASIGRQPEPAHGLLTVLRHPDAVVIAVADHVLRADVVLLCRQSAPAQRLREVLGDSVAIVIALAHHPLRLRVALVRGRFEPARRVHVMHCGGEAVVVDASDDILAQRVVVRERLRLDDLDDLPHHLLRSHLILRTRRAAAEEDEGVQRARLSAGHLQQLRQRGSVVAVPCGLIQLTDEVVHI